MATLYMMVGLPGSGKSEWASKWDDVVVHSSDKIREEILGDVNDQTRQKEVFDTLKQRVWNDLRAGRNVVYDATNVATKRRKHFLIELKHQGLTDVKKVCVFMATSFDECVRRNQGRPRTVPIRVIRRMYESFDPPMYREGWDDILIVDDAPDKWVGVPARLKILTTLEHDNPHHSYTVGQHCVATMFAYQSKYGWSSHENKLTAIAALLHDFGKETTKTFYDSRGNKSDVAHYYNHEHVGAYDSFGLTIGMLEWERIWIATLIRYHMYPFAIERSSNPEKTKSKLLNIVGDEIFEHIMALHECDLAAH